MTQKTDDRSVVSMVNGDRLIVRGNAEEIARRLNPAGAVGGGLNVLDSESGELVLVNSRHVVSVGQAEE